MIPGFDDDPMEQIKKAKEIKDKVLSKTKSKAKRYLTITACVILAFFVAPFICTTVKKGTYQIKQVAITGTMDAKMTPGIWWQLWADIDTWPKAFTFFFTHDKDTDDDVAGNMAMEVRFVDGSKCEISGTARVVMPSIKDQAINLVTEHGYEDWKDVREKLIRPTVRNALRMTANMMTAQESYSSHRINFNEWARTQIEQGLYQTRDEVRVIEDVVSGERVSKTFKVIKHRPIIDEKTGKQMKDENGKLMWGEALHQANPLEGTGITLKNFEVKSFEYATKVKEQIATQQEAFMAVATAKAKKQEAEQKKLQIEAEGKTKVARAKYEEEQIKVRAVVVAERDKEVRELNAARDKNVAVIAGEQRKEVAALDKAAAELNKKKNILDGEGIAKKKQLILDADGALQQKLDTYQTVMAKWADAFENRKVPAYMMISGGAGGTGGNHPDAQTAQFMANLNALTLQSLGLNIDIQKGRQK